MNRKPKVRNHLNLDTFNKKKKGCIFVKDRSSSNLASAVVIAIQRLNNNPRSRNLIKNQGIAEMGEKRQRLINGVAEKLQRTPTKIEDYQEAFRGELQFVCWSQALNFDVEYKGPWNDTQIYFIRNNSDKFDVITKPAGYLKMKFYCKRCIQVGHHRANHLCRDMCRKCHSINSHTTTVLVYCNNCMRYKLDFFFKLKFCGNLFF